MPFLRIRGFTVLLGYCSITATLWYEVGVFQEMEKHFTYI